MKTRELGSRKRYQKACHSAASMNSGETPVKSQPLALLLVGILSMVFAEVFSGSSVLWFFSAWSWFLTLPLYWSHTLFFLNLGFRLRRTSISDLYLFGVLFGLYESWVTKVVWAGYLGQTPAWGTFFGFAVAEIPVIVFFWHPVMSFIVPILLFEIIAVSIHGQQDALRAALPSHMILLQRNKRSSVLFGLVFVGGAAFLSANSGLNVLAAALTVIVSLLMLVLIVTLIRRRYGGHMSVYSLRLGKRGFFITTLYILLLYLVTFPLVRPEGIPGPTTLLLTFCFYAFIALLIVIDPAREEKPGQQTTPLRIVTLRGIEYAFGALLLMIVIMCTVPVIDSVVGVLLYLMIIFFVPILFIWTGARAILRRVHRQTVSAAI
jgi:hypothetical protein